MAQVVKKARETNDINLEPEKKPAFSTIKRQARTLNRIIEGNLINYHIKTSLYFDRLKIWIDLKEFGEKINFRKGKNFVASVCPQLPPYEQYRKKQEQDKNSCSMDYEEPDDYYENEYDEESVEEKAVDNVYPNCSIKYDIYKETLGINNIYIRNDKLVIDITGKIAAEYGVLGLISINNIKDILQKLQALDLFKFDTKKFLCYAGCYIADVTLDLLFPHSAQVPRMITAMSSFSPLVSDVCFCRKYKKNGLMIKRKAENTGYSELAYWKWDDICNSVKQYNKAIKYTEIIGDAGEAIAKRTLRLECHIYKMADLRKFLDIPNTKKGFVPLLAVLNSTEPVMLKMLKDMGINEYKLHERYNWFELNENFFREDSFTTKEEFQEIIIAEWLANVLKENDYKLDVAKAHIGTEYGFDLNDTYFNGIMPKLKEKYLSYVCYRKPRSVSSILFLMLMVRNEYYDLEYLKIKEQALNTT